MKYGTIFVLILAVSLLFIVGCNSSAQSRPNYYGGNTQNNQPQQQAGGCGVVAPSEDIESRSFVAQSFF